MATQISHATHVFSLQNFSPFHLPQFSNGAKSHLGKTFFCIGMCSPHLEKIKTFMGNHNSLARELFQFYAASIMQAAEKLIFPSYSLVDFF